MIIPIRCFTCGKVIADKYNTYLDKVNEYRNENEKDTIMDLNYISREEKIITPEAKALEYLKITRYCCKRHFLTHTDLINSI